MTTDDEQLATEYEQLQEMLASLDAAVAARDEAKARLAATARAVGAKLDRLGHFARVAETDFDAELARRIYWEYPDVHVAELAKPMNLREGVVARSVGTGTIERRCAGDCGRTITWHLTSRSDAQRQSKLCPDCETVAKADREARWARSRASFNAEHEESVELLRDHIEHQRAPYARYAEFPGVPGTWQVDENGVPLALLD